jgi:hypothetical protein
MNQNIKPFIKLVFIGIKTKFEIFIRLNYQGS